MIGAMNRHLANTLNYSYTSCSTTYITTWIGMDIATVTMQFKIFFLPSYMPTRTLRCDNSLKCPHADSILESVIFNNFLGYVTRSP